MNSMTIGLYIAKSVFQRVGWDSAMPSTLSFAIG